MDLHTTLPDFPTGQYAGILSALEKAEVTVKELLLFDALEIAKQTQVPVNRVRKFLDHVLDALHKDLGVDRYREDAEDVELLLPQEEGSSGPGGEHAGVDVGSTFPVPFDQQCISTLDTVLDGALAGGIRAGYVTEIAGESGCGKTQLLLHLLLAVQLPPPRGLGKGALYVATESELPTSRLSQLLSDHPRLSPLPEDDLRPSLENIRSITTMDLETQEHILNFQVPVAVERYGIGLVVIDSVTANYRAELSAENPDGLITRARELKLLGHFLRNLAVKHNIAIVVANQVSDQFGDLDDPLWTEEVDEVSPDGDPEDHFPRQTFEASRAVQASSVSESPPLQNVQGEDGQLSPNVVSRPGASFSSSLPPGPADDDAESDTYSLDLPDLETMLSLEHQKPFFTGWGGPYSLPMTAGTTPASLKAPALGLVWANQIACRIIIKVKNLNSRDKDESTGLGNSDSSVGLPGEDVDESAVHEERNDQDDTSGCVLTLPAAGLTVKTDNTQKALHTENLRPGEQDPREYGGKNVSPHLSTIIRKICVMEVIFSPWTSGNPRDSDSADNWEDIEDDEEDEEDDGDADDRLVIPEFELSAVKSVQFEILPSGVRGIRHG